jgi:uncharacterized protein
MSATRRCIVGTMQLDLQSLRAVFGRSIRETAARHGARNLRVFGSVARGEAGPDSDVDFLVDFEPDRSLVDRIRLTNDLAALLGRKVDVMTESAVYWLLRRRILNEARPLLLAVLPPLERLEQELGGGEAARGGGGVGL